MTNLRKFFISALLFSAFLNLSLCWASQAAPAVSANAKVKTSTKVVKSAAKQQNLRRFDFRLEGVSCGRCIVNIRTALRQTKGVNRCEVALRKPFGGVVVYDSSLTNVEKLTKIIITADPKTAVIVQEPVDDTIEKVPVVLIPKYTSLRKPAG
ncbi:heavy-metal-associated domain-containing protein [bacterium]|nr:heavy-metal-associated domain-containing protein [bacterium]MBP9808689.1 heavy-metal-associated domain-containing protein [bacterium]